MTPERRAEIEALVGEAAPIAPPGPQAGPIPGDAAAPAGPGKPTFEHADPRGLGETASEAG
ncbi:MAG: hypothetical protein M3P40_10635 [Actinomycetota bacterium]|nr:hypothetical protein [Actinomycetota bacterium]